MTQAEIGRDDRIMAAIAHACAIMLGMGVIGAIVIWATQKDRSRYLAFQALQATVYQIVGIAATMLGWFCWMAIYFASFIPLMAAADRGGEPPAFFWFSLLLMLAPMAFTGLWILGGLWGAIRCLSGHNFKYPIIGNWLEQK